MAIKHFRNWFFQATGTPGTRFLKNNKPTENVFRDFLASIGFFKEVSDTASTTQQGFVKKATNAQGKKGGRVSKQQMDWKDKLEKQGYAVVFSWGAEEAYQSIKDYLK